MPSPNDHPFHSFNFSIEINIPGVSPKACTASFAECDGLEMTIEAKTIREGGNNGRAIRLAGPFSYGTVTLKRGESGPVVAAASVAAATNVEAPSGSAVPV